MQIKAELQEFMGSDRGIAEAAWTSSYTLEAKSKRTDEDVARVINLLADEKHSVPFESVVLRFWLKLPIAIDRQLVKHRVASHSGLSGRYRAMPTEFLGVPDDVKGLITESMLNSYTSICSEANRAYKEACTELKAKHGMTPEYKRAREFMRGMLPQHNMTETVFIVNLRSFANFMKLRDKPNAQPEIQQLARLMLKAVEDAGVAPIALEAIKRNGWVI